MILSRVHELDRGDTMGLLLFFCYIFIICVCLLPWRWVLGVPGVCLFMYECVCDALSALLRKFQRRRIYFYGNFCGESFSFFVSRQFSANEKNREEEEKSGLFYVFWKFCVIPQFHGNKFFPSENWWGMEKKEVCTVAFFICYMWFFCLWLYISIIEKCSSTWWKVANHIQKERKWEKENCETVQENSGKRLTGKNKEN